jgi:hypothetical protein
VFNEVFDNFLYYRNYRKESCDLTVINKAYIVTLHNGMDTIKIKKICIFFSEVYYCIWLKGAKVKKSIWPYCHHSMVENGVGAAFSVIFGFAKISQLV